MSEAFTPGPWEADPPSDDPQNGDEPKCHWSVRAPGPAPCISHEVCQISGRHVGQDEHTARLIAAAPDLYAALKLCAAVCAGEALHKSGLIMALESAKAALAKARGEQA